MSPILEKDKSTISREKEKELQAPKMMQLTTSAIYIRATSSSKQPKFLSREYRSPPFKYSITRYRFSRDVNE
jgi:hypothetical protein